ncbi:recombination-associated protein RdgC [Salmonella enterica subsp. enterica serovar Anatum]|uniref:RdgC exonuclease n=2 Tax=Nonanavirus TaxID=1921122 RepID=S4TWL4_9CAUD|nr:RdgC exonuclease [Salmonella phage SP069]AGF89349.1 RdgC exonuclease [Salmonella phage FSL SP-062]KAA7525367.1 recombination-associated protein RdgC [Salmonella enterica subsp. enterica serovar Anatum]AGF89502.1 RdgC exonuclease [Salmonella phage SP069]KAA7538237.1 recombination-associated protein RdgC [Salmonella enterica subsp. enterica serovar Anatum]KAA7929227.1 recombination-associated protein RdgC [Salmonella enterica subsp. enterica serovar Anatum]
MNFFKNAIIYRLTNPMSIMAQLPTLETQLQQFKFTQCGSQDMARTGWVPATEQHQTLVHQANGQYLLTIQKQEKIIPGPVIKQELNARIAKLESEQGRKLKKTEKDALKDEVLHSLLPRAFVKNHRTQLWIDIGNASIVVDASSAKRAEDALALLRKSLGSLPVVPLTIENPVELTMTEWVRSGMVPAGFTMGDAAELKAILADGGIAKVKKQDLTSDEIKTHIEAGKLVTKLALDWQERITFTLSDSVTLSRLKFCNELLEQNDDIDHEDVLARFDADFTLMTGELAALINQLVTALGGEAKR